MGADKSFPLRPESQPTIYAYEDTNPQYAGLLKIGYTTVDAQGCVAQQYPVKKPGKPPYRIVLEECAMRNDGTTFTDREIHRHLRARGLKNPEGEWFACSTDDVRASVIAVRTGQLNEGTRSLDFQMRPEQRPTRGRRRGADMSLAARKRRRLEASSTVAAVRAGELL